MWQREWRNHDVMRGFLNCFVVSCPPEGVGRSCVDKLYKVAFVIRSRFAKGVKGGPQMAEGRIYGADDAYQRLPTHLQIDQF